MRAFILPQVALLLLATACAPQPPAPPATPPVGIDLGAAAGQRPTAPAAANPHAHHAPATQPGVRGHGTIDAIDPGRRRVTLAHDPMPEIGWPAMTMVFPVPAAVDLRRFKSGDHVDFTLRPGQGGTYDLIDLRPGDH